MLDKHITKVYATECPLYSDYLKLAGTCDCIAEWDGVPTIVDFKTSKRPKKKADIPNYFAQLAAYAVMWEERTKQPINQIVILVAVQDEPPQVFIQKRDDWIQQFINLREDYDKSLQLQTR